MEEGWVKPFTAIHIAYILTGTIKEKKAKQAVELAVEKYCSVAASLDPSIKISHSFEIIDSPKD
jgi:putative redox protein